MHFRLLLLTILLMSSNIYAFGANEYAEKSVHSVFPAHIQPTAYNLFVFDPNALQWAVYDAKGVRVGLGKGVGGRDFCKDINEPCHTVEGFYTVFRAGDADCSSKTFPIDEGGGAPMPHCMFFYKGYAIHGTAHLPNQNASHGCIRVAKPAAEWMNNNYISPGARVLVLPYKSESHLSG